MPSRYELENLATQWVSLWSAPVDWRLFDQLHSAEFVDCSSAGRPPTKDGFAAGLAAMVRAFPDLHAKVEQLVVDRGSAHIAVRWSATGTNHARYLGIGPSGRVTRITGIEIIEVRDGRVVRRWGEWDISAHADGV